MTRLRATRGALRFMLPATLLFLAACAAAPDGTSPASAGVPASPSSTAGLGPGSSADADAVQAASTMLNAARLDDSGSLDKLEGIRFTPAGTEAAARLIGSGASGDALWAATYVYASAAADPEVLRAVAVSSTASLTIRAMAGAGLVAAGELTGFEPLILALAASDQMEGSAPAGYAWEFAADVLERYTHTGFGPTLEATDDERATIAAQWQTWLETNRDHLRFDEPSQLWVVA